MLKENKPCSAVFRVSGLSDARRSAGKFDMVVIQNIVLDGAYKILDIS